MSMGYIDIQLICICVTKNMVIHVYKGRNQRKAQLLIEGQIFSANEIETVFSESQNECV